MSWGTRIAILYIGFVLMIATLIARTTMENTDLESADYYDRELHFQEQIDGAEALLNAGVKPVVTEVDGKITVQLPEGLSNAPSGKIKFYRPDNAKLDKEFDLIAGYSEYEKEQFTIGNYRIRIQWKNGGEDYFFETEMYVQ